MGTKISMAEKGEMAKIIKQDLTLIDMEIGRQLQDLWERCRAEIEHELGITAKKAEVAAIEEQISKLQSRISEIQGSIREYESHPKLNDYVDAGIDPPENRDGWIYRHDRRFFSIPITSLMDILIVKKIKTMFDVERPLMMLNEIAQSAYRALIMSGTYEEARKAYETFYNLDFQKYGVKIPRRLEEIKKVSGFNLLSAQIEAVPRLEGPKKPEEDPKGGTP